MESFRTRVLTATLPLLLAAPAIGQAQLPPGPTRLEATAPIFPLLDLQPLAGRAFTSDEDRPGATRVVLLAESIWRARFGSANLIEIGRASCRERV